MTHIPRTGEILPNGALVLESFSTGLEIIFLALLPAADGKFATLLLVIVTGKHKLVLEDQVL